MTYSKLIHEYLDGALDAANEEALFAELARDVELREEFNQQVQLQLIAQNDMSSITPPYETTNAIFSNLGFAVPANLPENQPAGGSNKLYHFFKKHFATIMLVLLFSSISIFTTIQLTNNNDDLAHNSIPISYSKSTDVSSNNSNTYSFIANDRPENNKNLTRSNNTNISHPTANNRLTNIPNNSTAMNNNVVNYNDENSNNLTNSISNNNLANSQITRNSNILQNISNPLIINNLQNTYNSVNPINDFNSNHLASANILTNNNLIVSDHFLNPNRFSIEITGLSSQLATPNINIPSNNNFFADNFSISGHYRLNNSNLLGISVGQENFPQSFKYGEFNDTYHQNPTLFWAAASYRHEFTSLNINDLIIPYSQVSAGATSVGPVFKGNLGIEFLPYKNFSITIGTEISSLLYNVSGTFYSTEKAGLTYGVKYNF